MQQDGGQKIVRRPPPMRIVLWVMLALLALGRISTSAAHASSLYGPVWVVLNAAVVAGAVLVCFDHVTVTAAGIERRPIGRPRNLPRERVTSVQVVERKRWVSLVVFARDVEPVPIATERRNTAGLARIEHLTAEVSALLGVPVGAPPRPQPAAAPSTGPRRCTRSSCAQFHVEVADRVCAECGSGTQRMSARTS